VQEERRKACIGEMNLLGKESDSRSTSEPDYIYSAAFRLYTYISGCCNMQVAAANFCL